MDNAAYRKLPGAVRHLFWTDQLWAGPDHVLAVHTALGVEHYRRFPYAEVQALVMRRTRLRLAINLVCGALGGLLLAGGALLASEGRLGPNIMRGFVPPAQAREPVFAFAMSVILFTPGLILLTALLINSLRGPTCALYFQTAAGVEPAGSPRRWRVALRVQQEIAPLILAAQAAAAMPSPAPASPPLP